MENQFDIREATAGEDLEAVRELFREYAASLPFDLGFQGFEEELVALPGAYAPPGGVLLLAWVGGQPVGCVGVRELGSGVAELKRLYVRPAGRRSGLGRALAVRAMAEAARLGHRAVRLDTVSPHMDAAIALYQALGFRPVPPYCHNPLPGASFWGLDLSAEPEPVG